MDTGVQTDWTGEHINEYEVMFSSQMDTINKQRDSLSDAINMLKTQNDQVSLLLKEVEQLSKKAIDLQKDLDHLKLKAKTCLLFDIVQSDDSKIHFYTGIPNLSAFLAIFNAAKKKVKRKGQKLDLKDECLLTLAKLRHNPSIQDLAYRFGISKSLANRIFHAWLDALYKTVGGLVIWPAPDKECQLPDVFNNEQFRKVRCIIDCTEIFIERPTRLKARAETFSNYKRHNTVKVLIGVSPSGCVTFISDVWGGRVSDKKITLESGLLDKFVPGDAIMADRGFLVHDEFAFRQVTLIMPAFTKGKKQLTAMEVEKSRQMSRARIHIERIIGCLKDFNILSGPLPIALVRKKGTVKKVLHVVSAIFNLNPAIV